MIAAILVGSAQLTMPPLGSEITVPVAPYTGRFTIRYQPVMCVRAPCPKGRYAVRLGDGRRFWIKAIDYDPATPQSAAKRAEVAGSGGLTIDGRIRIIRDAGGHPLTAVIRVRRTVPQKKR